MKTIIETATGKAIYLFHDDYPATISDTNMTTPDWRALDINAGTHSIVTGVPHPPTWAGNALQWSGTTWVTLDQSALDDAVAAAKTERKEALAAVRWGYEVGGTTVSGMTVDTDRETQSKMIAARIIAKEDTLYTVKWKMPTGFVTLDAATIITVADAVRAHVQACFDNEATHTAAIAALTTVADVVAYDYSTGWTTNPEVLP